MKPELKPPRTKRSRERETRPRVYGGTRLSLWHRPVIQRLKVRYDKLLSSFAFKLNLSRYMRVVLDGVFNHTGRRHFAFQDIQSKGAAKSEFRNWYILGAREDDYDGWCTVDHDNEHRVHGFSYDCWEGHPMLPRLNLAEPAAGAYTRPLLSST